MNSSGKGKGTGGKGGGGKGGGGKGGGGKGGGGKGGGGERKGNRRAAQMAAVDAKSNQEADFFWACVARAQKGTGKRVHGKAEELFGKQLTQGINFAQYEQIPVSRSCRDPSVKACEQIPTLEHFRDLQRNLPPFLFQNVQRMGYSVPTPIQKHAVPLALDGRADLMCCAQTGSGKTCAFLLPSIALIATSGGLPLLSARETPARPRVLVLAPTRELAIQIQVEAMKLTFGSAYFASVVYGGASARGQLEELAQGVDVLVATPGRLSDFLERGLVSLACCKVLILDEADRMLDMGFEPQLRKIVEKADLPPTAGRRTLMFSATFPESIQRLAANYLRPYAYIAVGRVGSTTASISQRLIHAQANSKPVKMALLLSALKTTSEDAAAVASGNGETDHAAAFQACGEAGEEMPSAPPLGRTIVFVQKKHVASWVKKELVKKYGVAAEDIHGDRNQSQREAALARFKEGTVSVLVATDVAARGLDVPNVNHVVNYDLPVSSDDFDSYVHRIGRTGRAGNTGLATSFYVPGTDAKTGNNGALWKPLHALFSESKQPLPAWFATLPEARGG
eukprot:CAMPEP_0171923748 /NCGR_PEP_ID=MMETSP0993-20121228/22419_1 /TAXON_ID=483369 /ORGANISM="non described non described, Strain CCMP2098" /LENGTH=565 /DNA_ID=CAMNT_0012561849 /DNA_START=29 /DNA_END=1723 /DNA_ORIENTATION=+